MSRASKAQTGGWVEWMDSALDVSMRWISAVCLTVLLCLVSLMVLVRFWPVVALGWEDEVVELTFAWMVFLGSAAVWRGGEHISIDFIPQALAATGAGRALELIIGAAMLGFLGVFTWYGWLLTLQSQGNTSPMLVLPRPLWYVSVPVSGLVMIGYTIVRMVKAFRQPSVKG
jgi:TRAP-type C4-dicarboxylate transport system permease small subunit